MDSILLTDLRVYSAKEVLYNCELVDNTKIVAIEDIPKGSVICESKPIFTFKSADTTVSLLITLNHLEDDVMNLLLEMTKNLYPTTDKEMWQKLSEYDSHPSDTAIVQMMQQPEHIIVTKVVYNAFDLDNGMKGLYFLPAKFNHSCVPNCKWIYNGNTVVFYAVKNIEKGEELRHCYYPQCLVEDDKEKRAEIISIEGRGKFLCDCTLCTSEEERIKNYHMYVTRCKLGCFTCGKTANSKCRGCSVALYCSSECQKLGWSIHKLVCGK